MKIRDYQMDAALWLSRQRHGTVVAPAGSGKTIIAACALSEWLVASGYTFTRKARVGWLANTVEQCQQAKAALAHFEETALLADVRVECAAAATDWTGGDLLIVDEAHHAATAPSWQAQITPFTGVRWGFTATPPEDAEGRAVMAALFGPAHVIGREAVAGCISAARVIWLDDTDPFTGTRIDAQIAKDMRRFERWSKVPYAELRSRVAWLACMEHGMVKNQKRNDAIVRVAVEHAAKQRLVLVGQVAHGEGLAKRIPGSALCHAKVGRKARRGMLDDYLAGRLSCLIATSLFDEGADLPNAEVLILASGGRSTAKTVQRTGRVLRIFAGKTGAVIYDFKDEAHPLTAKHANRRREIYKGLGYGQ